MTSLLTAQDSGLFYYFPINGFATSAGIVWYILAAIGLWAMFSKAGIPGILGIIPLVNVFFLVKLTGRSGWWALLYLVPLVQVVYAIIVALRVGRAFGKGGLFSFFLLFLFSWIGFLIVGFGSAKYSRSAA